MRSILALMMFSMPALAQTYDPDSVDRTQILFDSAASCLIDPLPSAAAKLAPPLCKGQGLMWADGKYLRVLARNDKNQLRQIAYVRAAGEMTLDGSAWRALCGSPLAVQVNAAEIALARSGAPPAQAFEEAPAAANKALAIAMKKNLLHALEGVKTPQIDGGKYKACFSGITAVVKNHDLQKIWATGEEDALRARLFPRMDELQPAENSAGAVTK